MVDKYSQAVKKAVKNKSSKTAGLIVFSQPAILLDILIHSRSDIIPILLFLN